MEIPTIELYSLTPNNTWDSDTHHHIAQRCIGAQEKDNMSFASQSICAARAFGNSPQAENRKENRQSCERTLKPQYLGHPENWPIVLMVYRAGGANTTHTGTQNTCARKQ